MTKKKLATKESRWESTKLGNLKYLPTIGSTQAPVTDFARIRSWGDKNSAITHDGLKVERQDLFYAEGYGIVKCLPTTMHFIFEDKSKKHGRWLLMCTCGSIAGIISYNEIKSLVTVDGTESGYILACVAGLTNKHHTGIFRHADNSTE